MTSLSLELIRTDGGTQMRVALSQETYLDYRDKWLAGVDFDPIDVFHDGAAYWLADGFHRYFGAREAKLPTIPCKVHKGTQRDAILFAAGANAGHGLRRTNEDKRMAVTALLNDDEWVEWSDGVISEKAAVSREFVSQIRNQLATVASSKAAIAADRPRVGRDGKKRKKKKGGGGRKSKASTNGHAESAPLPVPEVETPAAAERLSLPDAISELNTVIEEIKRIWPLDEMKTLAAKLRTAADHIREEK